MHEVRNALGTAMLAVSALELGNMSIGGATGGVLKRSLQALKKLTDKAIDELRSTPTTPQGEVFTVEALLADATASAKLDPRAAGSTFSIAPVDKSLVLKGNRGLLAAALDNLLQNAFKFTPLHGDVHLQATATGGRVLISVQDQCGGLPPGSIEKMFTPFTQRGDDRTGLGLGLSIARQSVVADGGRLGVQDLPGVGCVFTIDLPLHAASPEDRC